jgi:hypothetical protein
VHSFGATTSNLVSLRPKLNSKKISAGIANNIYSSHWCIDIPKMHRAGCAFNSRGNCVFILGDNAELIIIASKLMHQNCGGG